MAVFVGDVPYISEKPHVKKSNLPYVTQIRGCGHFLGDRTKGFGCVQSRGTQAGGGTLSHDINDDHRSGRTSRLSDQEVPGTLAGEGSPRHAGRMRIPIIPLETGQKAIELVLGGMRQRQAARRLGVETPPAMTVTWRRCATGSRSWNRGNSLMREVVEVRGKNRAPIRGFCRTRRRRCRPTV